MHHTNLIVCRLDTIRNRQTGYWYTVSSGSLPHTAFRQRSHLDGWLNRLGLSLATPLSDTEPGHSHIVGSYHTEMSLNEDALKNTVGEEVRWLSNGEYTLGKIATNLDGTKTVVYLNPNVRSRPVFDYQESVQMVG